MTERTKNWAKDNLMSIVIAAMIAAFWVSYEADRAETKEQQVRQDQQIYDLKVITFNLASAWDEQRDWKKSVDSRLTKHDEEFMELWKINPRSGKKTPSLLKDE